jgi:3-hydroxybutyryl-CoA dehydrogenase
MEIKWVGVIGAGVMGGGIAHNLAQTGHHVILIDISAEVLDRARENIKNALRFQRMFDKPGTREKPDEILARITCTVDYNALSKVDYIIENVTEKWSIKRDVYGQLDAVAPQDCIFATDTSCIPITKIGGVTHRPEKVIGIHFMNPVPMKQTVEVIKGWHTSAETLMTTKSLLAAMGKRGIVVNDGPGFVSNRVLMLTVNEAIFTVHDGTAEPEDVDLIFKHCFGHKMGPLETADLIGLDTILYSLEVLYENFSDSKYRPCPLLRRMVDAGLLGSKSGQGFYRY